MSDQAVEISRIPKWIKLVLGASLAANLMIFGLAAGAAWRMSSEGVRDKAPAGVAFVAALERQDRRAMMSEFRKQRRETGQDRRAIMEQVLATLRADTFDVVAMQSLVAREQQRSAASLEALQSVLLERMSEMTLDARRTYADRLETVLRRGPKAKRR